MPTKMEHVLDTENGPVWLVRLQRPFDFLSPVAGADFAAMLVVASDDVTSEEQVALSDALVTQGCRYAVCAGHDCSSWDDSIDFAFLRTDPDFDPPDERFVMTTWHDGESLDEVAWYFLWSTEFGDYAPCNFLVVILDGSAAFEVEVTSALRGAVAEDGGPA
jgi:hypothetical protein